MRPTQNLPFGRFCVSPILETANSDAYIRLLALGLRPTDPVCVFKPRVQVKDNWGWCNGSCNVAGNTGCYDNVADPFGGETDQCDPEEAEENGLVPWTEYKGEIIVVPR